MSPIKQKGRIPSLSCSPQHHHGNQVTRSLLLLVHSSLHQLRQGLATTKPRRLSSCPEPQSRRKQQSRL